MTTTVSYATANGRRLRSSDPTNYADAYAGTTSLTVVSGTPHPYGIGLVAGTRVVNQILDEYTYTLPTDEYVVTAYFRYVHDSSLTPSSERTLSVRSYDWGGTVTTADWRTLAQWNALPELAYTSAVNAVGNDVAFLAGGPALMARLATTGTVRTVTSTGAYGAGPSVDTQTYIESVDAAGTTSDPSLVYTTLPRSTLAWVMGAQAQLSDGTWATLEASAPAVGVAPTVTLVHHSGTVRTVIATVPTGTTSSTFSVSAPGQQALALLADSTDNLYVLGALGSSTNSLAARAYTKGVGLVWTAGTIRSTPLSSYDGPINNVVGAWHNIATSGTIVSVCSHAFATRNTSTSGQVSYAVLNCNYLLTGVGSILRQSGNAAGLLVSSAAGTVYNAAINETGSMLDIAPSSATRGYVVSQSRATILGEYYRVSQARYSLAADGTISSAALTIAIDTNAWGSKDAGAKARVLGASDTMFVAIAADRDSGGGIHPVVIQNVGTSSTFTKLGQTYLDDDGPSMPTTADLAVSPAWDALYDPIENTVWVYYLDPADANRLMRTDFDLNAMLASGLAHEVDAAVGAALSTVRGVRVARGANPSDTALVTCAVRSSGGAHSTVYVLDTFNQAPSSPTLTPKANYDATTASAFTWTFVDPNPGDTQSAYQLVIQTSAGAAVYDSGKVVSAVSSHNLTAGTLTNGNSYQWRVRTYDSDDVVGEYSAFSPFSVSAGGAVTITDPAVDNPAGVITDDYAIDWSVSGTTQAAYRVTMVRGGATVLDTGWVASTATTYNVTGMTTGVQHTISVKVRNAGLVESGTGTRLITPDYGAPEVPTLTISSNSDEGYIEIVITNPTPSGDRPEVTTNQILRRISETGSDYTIVGTADPDGTYRDYTVASGVVYDYVIRGVS